MRELDLDRRTAIVTHDPKLDDPGLEVALKSDAFYIGCSAAEKPTRAVERLSAAASRKRRSSSRSGGPAIGSISPAEIAVSILAQITEVLHRKIEARAAA